MAWCCTVCCAGASSSAVRCSCCVESAQTCSSRTWRACLRPRCASRSRSGSRPSSTWRSMLEGDVAAPPSGWAHAVGYAVPRPSSGRCGGRGGEHTLRSLEKNAQYSTHLSAMRTDSGDPPRPATAGEMLHAAGHRGAGSGPARRRATAARACPQSAPRSDVLPGTDCCRGVLENGTVR